MKAHYEKLYAKKFQFDSQKEQTAALNDVLAMLKAYMSGQRDTERNIRRSLIQMKGKVAEIERDARRFSKEMEYLLSDKNETPEQKKQHRANALDDLKKHMSGLKDLIHKTGGEEHWESVHNTWLYYGWLVFTRFCEVRISCDLIPICRRRKG